MTTPHRGAPGVRPACRAALAATVLWLLLAASAHAAGGMIVYSAVSAGKPSMWAVHPDGRGARKLVDGSEGTVSPDGTRLAFANSHGVVISGAGGSHLQYLTHAYTGFAGNLSRPQARDIVWSPNGRQVAFIGTTTGDKAESLLVAKVPHGPLRRLYFSNFGGPFGTLSGLTWSPSGQQLAFNRSSLAGIGADQQVFIVNAAGGPPVQFSHNVDGLSCASPGAVHNDFGESASAWGPHGLALQVEPVTCNARLAPPRWDNQLDVYEVLVDPAGNILRTLVGPNSQSSLPGSPFGIGGAAAWSPGGQNLLLFGGFHRSGKFAVEPLYTIPAAGGAPHRLGNIEALWRDPVSWSK